MKKRSPLAKLIDTKPVPEKVSGKTVSHSQFHAFHQCPHQWNLKYVEGIRPFSSTINTVFGTAMHETIQEYMRVMYMESGTKADQMKLEAYLHERMMVNYQEEVEKNNGEHFTTLEEISEFYEDGVEILRYLKKKRNVFFSIKGVELLGIEIHIMQPTNNPNVYFEGYIDMVLYDLDLDKVIIYDFKTSKTGWKDQYEKKDRVKTGQILLYKRFFSRQYEVPEEKIDVVFQILKRKIYEQAEFEQPRVSNFKPANGKAKVDEAVFTVEQFVSECFTPEGEYNLERHYEKNPGNACRWCPYNSDDSLCDRRPG
jgi:hypothetical protein